MQARAMCKHMYLKDRFGFKPWTCEKWLLTGLLGMTVKMTNSIIFHYKDKFTLVGFWVHNFQRLTSSLCLTIFNNIVKHFLENVLGLSLSLFIEQNEYIDRLAPAAGARVVIHDFDYRPFPEDEGFSVVPGHTTAVFLRKVRKDNKQVQTNK